MMAVRLLLIEDEIKLADNLRKGFEEIGYPLRHATGVEGGMELLKKGDFDIVILDLILGDEDGLEFCRRTRSAGNAIPILILSARDRTEEKVTGLELGADDYLTKPFAFPELVSRVRALMRRKGNALPTFLDLNAEGVEIDLNHRTASRDGTQMTLTPKEFSLLEFFVRNPGKLATRAALAEKIWDKNIELNTNVIDIHIYYLRKKLNAGAKTDLIHSVRGAGYIFEKRP